MRRAFVVVVVIAVAAIAVVFLRISAIQKARQSKEAAINAAESEVVIPIKVAPVATGTIEKVLRYTGTAEPAERVDVFSKIAGRILEIRVREGSSVSKDQVVAVVDPEVTGVKFEPYEVVAPIAGKVSRVYVDPGAFATQASPIVEVINDAQIRVEIMLLEKDYASVRQGTPVRLEFDALPGRQTSARITNVSPVVDPQTGTAKAEVALDNASGTLKAGMFARVRVVVEVHEDAVLMPRQATLREVLPEFGSSVETTVFTVSGDAAVEREITLGLADGERFEVLEGLRPGDVVVVVGQTLLRNGTKVRIVEGQ